MLKILDIDMDFFVEDVAYWRQLDGSRLDPNEFPPWNVERAVMFLEEQCLLSVDRKLPGKCVENHGDLFAEWRRLIGENILKTPFHLTHIDAHADLGLGDAGYVYLITELMHKAPELRTKPQTGFSGLNNGNFLAFACACRWISHLTYVHHPQKKGTDINRCFMKNFNSNSDALEFVALNKQQLDNVRYNPKEITPLAHDPVIPIRRVPLCNFQSATPFDYIFVSRSPEFTPPECDKIFEIVSDRYINQII